MAVAMDSPARPLEELGVTKLKDKCNHVFCKKEYSIFTFCCNNDVGLIYDER